MTVRGLHDTKVLIQESHTGGNGAASLTTDTLNQIPDWHAAPVQERQQIGVFHARAVDRDLQFGRRACMRVNTCVTLLCCRSRRDLTAACGNV